MNGAGKCMNMYMKFMKILIINLSNSPFFWLRSRAILNDKGNKTPGC